MSRRFAVYRKDSSGEWYFRKPPISDMSIHSAGGKQRGPQ
jgi:hypothetical protein